MPLFDRVSFVIVNTLPILNENHKIQSKVWILYVPVLVALLSLILLYPESNITASTSPRHNPQAHQGRATP